ncbi:cupin domain-containing protein [Embleya sp. NPDC050154]|uniref:cupin domain-containing protein n=1 Tax=unclassified Embleya TaxID=2699296 RepID=UPI0037A01E8D
MTHIDVFEDALRLAEGGRISAGERRMSGADGADGVDQGWQLAAFHVETDADLHADHWEMHPESDEVVCVWTGALRIVLRAEEGAGEESPVTLRAGGAFVVPRGRWHRLEIEEPADLMSISRRSGTRLERRAGRAGERA